MHDLPSDTLRFYAANPASTPIDWSHIPLSEVSARIRQGLLHQAKRTDPESDALAFYFMNHAFHTLTVQVPSQQPLDPELAFVADQHLTLTSRIAQRLLFYSVLVCAEEARFLPSQPAGFFEGLEIQYGREFCEYIQGQRPGSLPDLGHLDMTIGSFANAMVSVFALGRWQPGYGGRGWTPIASLVSDCVHGRISLELFADQAFSLCHNNGSMFNKGHFYNNYTSVLYTLLDIQDSGQMPQWLAANTKHRFVSEPLARVQKIMAARFPEAMTGPVNQALIHNSQEKRERHAQQVAKNNAAHWNANAIAVDPAQAARDRAQERLAARTSVLLDGLASFKGPGR